MKYNSRIYSYITYKFTLFFFENSKAQNQKLCLEMRFFFKTSCVIVMVAQSSSEL
jgi:hypothetical protein